MLHLTELYSPCNLLLPHFCVLCTWQRHHLFPQAQQDLVKPKEDIGKADFPICINLGKLSLFPWVSQEIYMKRERILKDMPNDKLKWFQTGRALKWLFQVTGKIRIVKVKTYNLEPLSRYCSINFQFE